MADDSWYPLLRDCLQRTHPSGQHELPVIFLLGLAGTGKTATLARISDSVRKPPSPVVNLPLHAELGSTVADVIQRITYDLAALDKVHLPRTVFTLVVLGLDPELPRKELEDQLQRSLQRKARIDPAVAAQLRDIASLLPKIGIWLKFLVYAAELLGRHLDAADRVHRVARTWLSERLGGDVLNLVQDQKVGGERAEGARGILVEAFLEDLAQAWAKPRHARNCLLLLDDADTPAGSAFLQALVAARARRSEAGASADPLVVVAASRTWPKGMTGWACPGTPGARRPPPLAEATYEDWLGRRDGGEQRWWYPVLMPGLRTGRTAAVHARAVHELTGGYPYAAGKLGDLLGNPKDDDEFRAILCEKDALRRLMPDHLPRRDLLMAWSAARNVDDAENALPDGASTASHLRRELAERLWLTAQSAAENRGVTWEHSSSDGERITVIHPWLRRLLLHHLAAEPERWDQVHETMESFYRKQEVADDASAVHHTLARVTDGDDPRLETVVAFLNERFAQLDVVGRRGSRLSEWVELYEQVTAAPNRLPLGRPSAALFDSLAVSSADTERRDRTSMIRTLVVARWFWLDPVLDPPGRRAAEIAYEFRQLAGLRTTGRSIFIGKAEQYEQHHRR
ncbi:hypothetical protein [Nonomuraea sp. NPDC005650]|uniref:hypothetical protein n=1 Tax=Nonomuraea sp. NPDC005650 TaxID=3157045 RepID=UPI0033BB7A5C